MADSYEGLYKSPLLFGNVLPEVVGNPISEEEESHLVQNTLHAIAEEMGFIRMVAAANNTSEGMLTGVGSVGITEHSIRNWNLPLLDSGMLGESVRCRQIVYVENVQTLPHPLSTLFKAPVVLIPLAIDNRVPALMIGELVSKTDVNSESWRVRALEISGKAALVVEIQRLMAAYIEEGRRRSYLREIAASILEEQPLSAIGTLVTNHIAARLKVDRVGLFQRDANGIVTPVALLNVSPEFGLNVARIAGISTRSRADATTLPIHIHDVHGDNRLIPEMRGLMIRENVRSLLMVMLQHGELVRGALTVYLNEDRSFTPAELSTFQSLGDMATLGIAMSQQLEQSRVIATLEERSRLGREIHDTVAQSLVSLSIQLDTALHFLKTDKADEALPILQSVQDQARLALQETRRAVQDMSPKALENRLLSQAVSLELQKLDNDGIVTQLVVTGQEPHATSDWSVTLLRIAQEAITNAWRHARAQRVRVGLTFGEAEVMMFVEDDGIGFDTRHTTPSGLEGGYGLFGMEERARLAGGEMDIDSSLGWGTRLRARVPYTLPSITAPSSQPTFVQNDVHQNISSSSRDPESTEKRKIRLLIVDDHLLARQGLKVMLETTGEIEVVGEAETVAVAEKQIILLHPDVVLLDLNLPDASGLELLTFLSENDQEVTTLLLSSLPTPESVAEALRRGARGFLLKETGGDELVSAINAARRGETVLTHELSEQLVQLATKGPRPTEKDQFGLNEREKEVLELLARGARNKEIASQLFIAPKTVESHLSSIFGKLGVSNRTEAARAAFEHGLIENVKSERI